MKPKWEMALALAYRKAKYEADYARYAAMKPLRKLFSSKPSDPVRGQSAAALMNEFCNDYNGCESFSSVQEDTTFRSPNIRLSYAVGFAADTLRPVCVLHAESVSVDQTLTYRQHFSFGRDGSTEDIGLGFPWSDVAEDGRMPEKYSDLVRPFYQQADARMKALAEAVADITETLG